MVEKCDHGKNWSGCFQQAVVDDRFPGLCLTNIASEMQYWFFRKISRKEDIEDLVQELLIALSQYFRSFDTSRNGAGRSYVVAMARNICVQYFKKQQSLQPLAEFEAKDRSANATDIEEAVRHCIAKLEPKLRVVIIHRDIEGLSSEDVIKITNIPLRTQHHHRQKAYTQLKKCLERQGLGDKLGDIQ